MPEAASQAELSAILARRRALEEQKDEILDRVMRIFDEDVPDSGLWPRTAQLQNLRTVAALTDSVREVEVFIRYQMGRTSPPIKREFGEAVLRAIQDLSERDDPELSIEKVRYFLGNLVRYAAYKQSESRPRGEEETEG